MNSTLVPRSKHRSHFQHQLKIHRDSKNRTKKLNTEIQLWLHQQHIYIFKCLCKEVLVHSHLQMSHLASSLKKQFTIFIAAFFLRYTSSKTTKLQLNRIDQDTSYCRLLMFSSQLDICVFAIKYFTFKTTTIEISRGKKEQHLQEW